MKNDIVFKNGFCWVDKNLLPYSLGIKDGKIQEISQEKIEGERVVDLKGSSILPGFIDSQVHFREPGLVHKETIEKGSRAALLGGITAFFEMPNTTPPTTQVERLNQKIDIGKKTSHTNFGFYAGATLNNLDELKKMIQVTGCVGIKVFMGSSTGSLLLEDDKQIEKILKETNCVVAFHAEDEALLKKSYKKFEDKDGLSVFDHPTIRSPEVALKATKRLIAIAKSSGRKVHILHISTKEEMDFLKDKKDFCTIEVTPQHLSLSAPDCYDVNGSFAQMNPPIRTKDHQDALWKALLSGLVDVAGSDHAPHTVEEKEREYPLSPSGIPGVQTMPSLLLDLCIKKRMTLEKVVDLLNVNPRKLFGLGTYGAIKLGNQANLSIFNLSTSFKMSKEWLSSQSGHSPFENQEIECGPKATVINGNLAMLDGKVLGTSKGEPININY